MLTGQHRVVKMSPEKRWEKLQRIRRNGKNNNHLLLCIMYK